MQLTTTKTLTNNYYSVKIETVPTAATIELMSDFGEPTISLGGNYYGWNSITFSTALADRTYIVGDTSGATGYVVDTGTIHQLLSTPNFTTEGVNSSASTISALSANNYTITASTVLMDGGFPATTVFTTSANADIYASESRYRINAKLTTLRAKTDTFSGTYVETL